MADDQSEIELRAARLRCRLVDATRELGTRFSGLADSYGSWTELGDKLPTGTVAAVLAELVVKRVRAARDEHAMAHDTLRPD